MTTEAPRQARLRRLLDQMAEHLIRHALRAHEGLREGDVLTVGPPAYRRLDCDGRAVVYIRPRPRKAVVRLDMSGLWRLPGRCPLRIASATGSSLLVRNYEDVDLAVAYLVEVIELTRRAHRRAA